MENSSAEVVVGNISAIWPVVVNLLQTRLDLCGSLLHPGSGYCITRVTVSPSYDTRLTDLHMLPSSL